MILIQVGEFGDSQDWGLVILKLFKYKNNRFLKYVQLADLCWLLRHFVGGLIYILLNICLNITLFRDRRRSSVVSLSGTANHWQRHSKIRKKLFDNFQERIMVWTRLEIFQDQYRVEMLRPDGKRFGW